MKDSKSTKNPSKVNNLTDKQRLKKSNLSKALRENLRRRKMSESSTKS